MRRLQHAAHGGRVGVHLRQRAVAPQEAGRGVVGPLLVERQLAHVLQVGVRVDAERDVVVEGAELLREAACHRVEKDGRAGVTRHLPADWGAGGRMVLVAEGSQVRRPRAQGRLELFGEGVVRPRDGAEAEHVQAALRRPPRGHLLHRAQRRHLRDRAAERDAEEEQLLAPRLLEEGGQRREVPQRAVVAQHARVRLPRGQPLRARRAALEQLRLEQRLAVGAAAGAEGGADAAEGDEERARVVRRAEGDGAAVGPAEDRLDVVLEGLGERDEPLADEGARRVADLLADVRGGGVRRRAGGEREAGDRLARVDEADEPRRAQLAEHARLSESI
mmetsp:Transcript_40864/g.99055  ORF Transcript_40864/g.99055 Transcript_40864/m.99055 type:complete len:333 (-) Transcript_40864:246-1244(-)